MLESFGLLLFRYCIQPSGMAALPSQRWNRGKSMRHKLKPELSRTLSTDAKPNGEESRVKFFDTISQCENSTNEGVSGLIKNTESNLNDAFEKKATPVQNGNVSVNPPAYESLLRNHSITERGQSNVDESKLSSYDDLNNVLTSVGISPQDRNGDAGGQNNAKTKVNRFTVMPSDETSMGTCS